MHTRNHRSAHASASHALPVVSLVPCLSLSFRSSCPSLPPPFGLASFASLPLPPASPCSPSPPLLYPQRPHHFPSAAIFLQGNRSRLFARHGRAALPCQASLRGRSEEMDDHHTQFAGLRPRLAPGLLQVSRVQKRRSISRPPRHISTSPRSSAPVRRGRPGPASPLRGTPLHPRPRRRIQPPPPRGLGQHARRRAPISIAPALLAAGR